MLWFLLVPVCVLWAYIEPVLLALGQPEALSRDVQGFLRVLILGAPGYIGFESLKKYLQCQGNSTYQQCRFLNVQLNLGIMGASTMVLAIVSPVNIVLNVGLIHHTSFGLLGCPLALSITYWMCFILLGVWTYFSPTHRSNRTWGGFCPKAVFNFRSCYQFFTLAVPGILMVGTEW